jgi:DNA polymerase-1
VGHAASAQAVWLVGHDAGVATTSDLAPALVGQLRGAGVGRSDLVALVVAAGVGLGLAAASGKLVVPCACADPAAVIAVIEEAIQPRWVTWSSDTLTSVIEAGVGMSAGWDIAAVHRLLFGGWHAEPAMAWACIHDLPTGSIPSPPAAIPDLFSQTDDDHDSEGPLRADGHLDPTWTAGGWSSAPERLAWWAAVALECAEAQQRRMATLDSPQRALATARSESAAARLCVELAVEGLPMNRDVAEAVVARFVGPRPRDAAEAAAMRAARTDAVLAHAPAGGPVDLGSPTQVKSLLQRIGVDVPDTRAWRLRALTGTHPLIDALLQWRKAERIATTYGYAWLDNHLRGGRLRGTWTGSDGAAGRMTASAGLHNMPAELREAVIAEPGHLFVRADLGQIEPRVLAAISGDRQLARASAGDDMYAPVAAELGVGRSTAKVAVLGAMYGQTTGDGARALRRLHETYPVAMALLEEADRTAREGNDLRTYGGRLIRIGLPATAGASERQLWAQAGARGRYGRNAIVQGAAAELFKLWAVTVRGRAAPLGARIVLCLHDELLVHTPAGQAEATAALVSESLQEAAWRWARDTTVRFVADVSVVSRWSDAKA